jgi:hypothetical protein
MESCGKNNWQLGSVEGKTDNSRFRLNKVNAVGIIVLGVDKGGIKVHIPVVARMFPLLLGLLLSNGYGGLFSDGKVAGAHSITLSFI